MLLTVQKQVRGPLGQYAYAKQLQLLLPLL